MMGPQLVKKGQQEAGLFGVLKRADRVPEQKNGGREPGNRAAASEKAAPSNVNGRLLDVKALGARSFRVLTHGNAKHLGKACNIKKSGASHFFDRQP